ncbi:LysM peptidoglycan-binding domain-containing protein [Devosia chinhatensis]|nr:LysM peptidoglycan-binding domain-containing protein [Devosia chinhatensis]
MIILGVLSGPALVSCFNSADGMGVCLRGKMADLGLAPPLPAPAVAETEAAPATEEASAAAVGVAATDEAVSAAPELDVTPPAPAEAISDDEAVADDEAGAMVDATFGLLRAEPDGSVVIAGSGTPGSQVEVFANGDLLGSVEVEPSGDWVLVPDEGLEPGDLEITLGEEGKTGTAEQSFIVVLNEDRTTQPLVVASTPGQASEVLQGLEAPDAVVADAPEAAPDTAEAPMETAMAEPAATEPASTEPTATEQTPEPTAPAQPEAVPTPGAEPAPTTAPLPADAPATAVADVPQPASAPAATPLARPEEPAPASADTQTALASEPQPATPPAVAPAAVAAVQPTIDAIEVDGQTTFFAGSGPDEGVIRLYVDDAFVADAEVDGGRWLVEAGPVLDKPSQRVRVDLIQPPEGAVLARAEVDFVVDVPADAANEIVVADAPAISTPAPAAQPAPLPAAEAPAASSAPTPTPETEPAEAVSSASSVASSPAEPTAPAQPVAPPPAATPALVEADPAPAEPAVPTMVAVSLGDAEAQRFASGKAIIRRGDNLWTIARRVYGEGVKYTAIYQANTGQIRDPDRIYPGQVFDLPTE